MIRLIVAILALGVTVLAIPSRLPDPFGIAFKSDDQFEDYLDAWLAAEQAQWFNETAASARSGNLFCLQH